ncbi:hypothetical protein [Qaidamihabitans albus]|uniref:hypothetical protein n=1 Tax=Qaidamihabitans albus TaxID=2795733 RepID=UPI0018F1D2C8|nr:hypothetical protein [Qaidamihabitans albus]
MLTYGTADNVGYLLLRVLETSLGAAVGVAVNLLVIPPMHQRSTHRSVEGTSREVERLLRTIAGGLRDSWTGGTPGAGCPRHAVWRPPPGTPRRPPAGPREHLVQPRRLLPWRRRRVTVPSEYESAISALHEVTKQVQHITDTLIAAGHAENPDNTRTQTTPRAQRTPKTRRSHSTALSTTPSPTCWSGWRTPPPATSGRWSAMATALLACGSNSG